MIVIHGLLNFVQNSSILRHTKVCGLNIWLKVYLLSDVLLHHSFSVYCVCICSSELSNLIGKSRESYKHNKAPTRGSQTDGRMCPCRAHLLSNTPVTRTQQYTPRSHRAHIRSDTSVIHTHNMHCTLSNIFCIVPAQERYERMLVWVRRHRDCTVRTQCIAIRPSVTFFACGSKPHYNRTEVHAK